jgi:protein-disulfide isomerase/uncharacterized membrane protein
MASVKNAFLALAGVSLLAAGALHVQGPAGWSLLAGAVGALFAVSAVIASDTRKGISAASGLAFAAAAYLYSRKLDASGSAICNVNEVLNCDAVNTSAASEIFGIPIVLIGMGLYIGLGLAGLSKRDQAPLLHQGAIVLGGLSTIYSGYLGYEAAQIGAVCAMCMTMYACHLLMIWAGFRGAAAEDLSPWASIQDLTASRTIRWTSNGVVLALLLGFFTRPPAKPDPLSGKPVAPQSGNELASLYWKPNGPVAIPASTHTRGNPKAAYHLVEFADYACPHCARAAKDVKQLVAAYPEVRVSFVAYPLTSTCNPNMEFDQGPQRCRAAAAVLCAGNQGGAAKFWELNNLLFANQGHHEDADLTFMAGQIGLDTDKLVTCMATSSTAEAILDGAKAGGKTGLMGTPTMFLQGTHGSSFIEVKDAGAVAQLVEAHRSGRSLPAPGQRPQH